MMKKSLAIILSLLVLANAAAAVSAAEESELLEGKVFGSGTDVNGAGYAAVFDGELDTYFEAEQDTSDAYVGIKLDSPVQLTEIQVTPKGGKANTGNAPIYKLDTAPEDALAEFSDGTVVWIAYSGYSGETADNLFDEKPSTKWCHADSYSYVVWELPEAVSITGYQIVTANDNAEYPGRNPGSFILYGCNDYDSDIDDGSWEAIDTVEDSVAEGLRDLNWTAFTFTDFDVAEVPAYKYYMFEINSVVGGGIMQMSGLNLIYEGKEAPSADSDDIQAEVDAEAAAAIAEGYAFYEADSANYTYPSSGTAVPEGSVLINGDRIGDIVGWGNNGAAATFAAFDGNFENYFDPPTMGVSYCGLDAGEEMILTKIMIHSTEDFLFRFDGAKIQGSNDKETWTDIFVSNAEAAELAMIDYSDQIIAENNTGYRYFRYFNEETEGDVVEIELYGYAKDGSNPTYEPFVFRAADYDDDIKEYLGSAVYAAKLDGLEIQGSTDGENWVTLYTMDEERYTLKTHVITSDRLNWEAREYTFDQFRAINYKNDLAVAEIGLYGAENASLPAYSYEAVHGSLLEGTLFGSEGSNDTTYEMLFDGDTDTYFEADNNSYAGMELDEPVQLTGIRLTPRVLYDFPEVICHEGVNSFGGESYDKLFDYNSNTKWCVVDEETPYVVWEMPEAVAVTGYQIVTANDASLYTGRNPNAWELYGSNDGDSWKIIDSVADDEILQDADCRAYDFDLGTTAPAYKYFKLIITENDGGNEWNGEITQLSGFNLIYDGCMTQENGDANAETRNKLDGLKIQGSVNGEDWITLYRCAPRAYNDADYTVAYHMLGSAAKEYKYTMFRVYNDFNLIELAEVEFYGIVDSQLPEFPAEVTEPIYSYVDAFDIFDCYDFGDWDYIYNDDEEYDGLRIWDEFENPVFIIGGVLPENTVVDVSEITAGGAAYEVIGYGPCAFYLDSNVAAVAANENLRYVDFAAFGNCDNMTKVEINKYLRYVECRAFAWNDNFTEFYGAEELLSEEEIEERGGKYLNTRDGYLYRGDTIITYPMARNAGGSFTVPNDIKYIGDHAFNCVKLKSVDLGKSVEEIGWVAFADSDLETIALSPNLRVIKDGAIRGTDISEVVIPSSVTEILYEAFIGSPNLTKVTILSTGDFNDGRASDPYHDIFDIAEDGKSVPVVYLYEGTQAHEAAIDGNWRYEFLEEDDDTDAPKIVVSSAKGKAGDTVEVTVSLENNPGIASLGLIVEYDEEILTLNQITYNAEIGGISQLPQTLNSPVKLTWINGSENTYGDWVFATMTFTISETIVEEVSTPITITYDPEDIYDISETNIDVEVVNGGVDVISFEPGDINEDGKVNNKDLTRLFQYIAGWDVDYNPYAIDVNGDGKVNNKDLTRLFQYIAGWDVEIY